MKETLKSVDTRNNFPYLDILYLEHPISKNHQRMSNAHRAGQFSPFAALTGFSEQIEETTRITDREIHLSEEEQQELDQQLQQIEKHSIVQITYFIKDKRKKGGSYQLKEGMVKTIDRVQKQIVFENKEKINIKDIIKIRIIDKKHHNLI